MIKLKNFILKKNLLQNISCKLNSIKKYKISSINIHTKSNLLQTIPNRRFTETINKENSSINNDKKVEKDEKSEKGNTTYLRYQYSQPYKIYKMKKIQKLIYRR